VKPRWSAAETLKAYTGIASPIFEQIQKLQHQNQELATLRDWPCCSIGRRDFSRRHEGTEMEESEPELRND